ncbi:putative cytochrome p450 [Diaporthe ampelina]|uniref:Putative cytochrome p450 n=1 Tax=Diaporthe ampelina TaxID=1214573 RepID=A0A0G2HFU9_9PEZI|nr:putative cytochrome p450 [Diaporthe ampelina]
MGDVPEMLKHHQKYATPFTWMTAQAEKLNSPIVQIFMRPLSRPIVIVTDPREAQDVVLRRAKDFDRSMFFNDAFGGVLPNHHIIQPTNQKFRQGRRLLADTMTTGFLNKVAAPSLHRHILKLMDLWRIKSKAAKGYAFWVAEDINHMALDSIWDVAFGSQLLSIPTEIELLSSIPKFEMPAAADEPMVFPAPDYNSAVKSMKVITHTLDATVTSPMPKQTHWLISMTPSYRRARAHKERLIRERLEDAKARLLGRGDHSAGEFAGITSAVDHMVRREAQAAAKEGRAPQYDSASARDEMFGFLIAGHDTTATTLMWAVKHMAASPGVQGKLRGVLRAAFGAGGGGGGVPTAEQISTADIPYLDAVVEEMVRCAGTSPATMRTAVHDTMLLGHTIPKGVDVFMMSNGPGYMAPNTLNESIPEHARSASSQANKDRAVPPWDPRDMTAFKPERWIKTDGGGAEVFDIHSGPVLQFGGGLRGCFGKKMAYLEMKIFIALLVCAFDLETVPEKLRGFEAFDCLTHKPKQCYVVLKEAEKSRAD